MAKMSTEKKLAYIALVCVILGGVGALLALQAKGNDATHTKDIDFSKYMSYLALPAAVAGLALLIGIPVYRGAKAKKKGASTVFLAAAIIGCLVVSFYAVFTLRCWIDNSKTADIEVDGTYYASGDFQINSAQLESYHTKDTGRSYDYGRILFFEDKYLFSIEINCTNFTDDQRDDVLYYNDTTITLQGFNIQRDAVTGLYAPKTQSGDFGTDGSVVVVFENIDRQDNNPTDQMMYYNITLLNSDDELLASWIIHPNIELNRWTLDTAI